MNRNSIEILPPGWESTPNNQHHPFEFTEGHLGIPKKVYYEVYMRAIKRFDHLIRLGSAQLSPSDELELQEVTGVILLVNPAHSTCLNRRRDIVEKKILAESRELEIIGAIQMQKDGAKSSILWSYRRWLFRRLFKEPNAIQRYENTEDDGLEQCSIPPTTFAQELSLITTTCEIYPRNYHGWLHRYKLLRSLATSYDRSVRKEELAQMLRMEEFTVKKWIEFNVSDYTAMQYLCQVYATMEHTKIPHIHIHTEVELESGVDVDPKKGRSPFSPVEHALELIERYPKHEALWYYRRSAYAVQSKHEEVQDVSESNDNILSNNYVRWRVQFDSRTRKGVT
jgi:protein prenyltransferase alpha subunit repeat containing protein 1